MYCDETDENLHSEACYLFSYVDVYNYETGEYNYGEGEDFA